MRASILLAFAILTVLSAALLMGNTTTGQALEGQVSWIYDGDTIKIKGIGKVRLLGLDTPEYEASGRDRYYTRQGISPARLREVAQQAKHYMIQTTKGVRVSLKTDGNDRDKHGRLLAYVYLPDGTMVNRLLLQKGLASVFRRYDFSKKKEFLSLERRAQEEELGLWKD